MYLHLCKVFDMAPHHVLTSKLKRYGFVGWTIWQIRNGWMVAAVVNSSTSRWRLLRSGVPQQSMWGPVFVNIFTNSTGVGIKCTHSKFAEDTRLGSGQAWIRAQTGRRTWEKPWRKGLEEKPIWASSMQSQPGRPGVLWAASTEGCKQAVGEGGVPVQESCWTFGDSPEKDYKDDQKAGTTLLHRLRELSLLSLE